MFSGYMGKSMQSKIIKLKLDTLDYMIFILLIIERTIRALDFTFLTQVQG